MCRPTNPWNVCAAEHFSRAFFGAKRSGWFENISLPPELTRSEIEIEFLHRFYDLKKKWVQIWKPTPQHERDAELHRRRQYARRATVRAISVVRCSL